MINISVEEKMNKLKMDKLVIFCKTYGYIFQGSEIYGGLANTWDYGPLGIELKNNIKKIWWKTFIQELPNSYGIDCSILMNPDVWVASGHVDEFNDLMIDCKSCKARYRADNLIENFSKEDIEVDGLTKEEMSKYIIDNKVSCPKCGESDFTDIREFNLMFETKRGVTGDKNEIYLRPETAQGQFVNFSNVQRSLRAKIPFGIGQIGKAFRNEITPGNFIFRTIEFEQMEYQYFCKPGTDQEHYRFFKKKALDFFKNIGIKEVNLKYKDHQKLAHYAKEATDLEYLFPSGWGEVNGTHSRTDFDLKKHQEHSKKSMEYLDPVTNEKYLPYIIESTVGVDRAILVALCDAYDVEQLENDETREVLRLKPNIAPYKVAVLPLIKKIHKEKALEIYGKLSKHFMISYDETGKIGKRYRRQDVIGTPYAVTIDDNTLTADTVTVRNRDTMKQVVLKIEDLVTFITDKINE